MKFRMWLAGGLTLGLLGAANIAAATIYNVDCGTSGATDAVQAVVNSIGTSPVNTINVTGNCTGDLSITRADRLTVSGLTVNGNVRLDSTTLVSFANLHLTGGQLQVNNGRRTSFSNAVVNGEVYMTGGSSTRFTGLTMAPYSDSAGVHDPDVICAAQSECMFFNLTLSGSRSAAGTGNTGLLAASASRLSLYSGTITGFDIGVQVWNNATAFLTTLCDNIQIASNLSTGVYVTDGGRVKIEGTSAADSTLNNCPAIPHNSISGNGQYGVLADGGGNAYINLTNITGHSVDGLRVQHGSIARVRSSTLDAAGTGRSARVKNQAHLYFDEQSNGSTASSTLAGPVCVTDGSTVDTSNSATQISVQTTCGSP